jgi:putative protease
MLPELMDAGVSALKIEGRQRGKAYVSEVVTAFRRAVDAATNGDQVETDSLMALSEGGRKTAGAYDKEWR